MKIDGKSEDPSAQRPPAQNRPTTILVVDDDADIRDVLTATLQRDGYDVVEAADGEDAWTQLLRGQVDLLITDHDMPRLTGLELLKRLQEHSRCIPAILISGYMPWAEIDSQHFDQICPMCKPFSLSLIRLRTKELLAKQRVNSRTLADLVMPCPSAPEGPLHSMPA